MDLFAFFAYIPFKICLISLAFLLLAVLILEVFSQELPLLDRHLSSLIYAQNLTSPRFHRKLCIAFNKTLHDTVDFNPAQSHPPQRNPPLTEWIESAQRVLRQKLQSLEPRILRPRWRIRVTGWRNKTLVDLCHDLQIALDALEEETSTDVQKLFLEATLDSDLATTLRNLAIDSRYSTPYRRSIIQLGSKIEALKVLKGILLMAERIGDQDLLQRLVDAVRLEQLARRYDEIAGGGEEVFTIIWKRKVDSGEEV